MTIPIGGPSRPEFDIVDLPLTGMYRVQSAEYDDVWGPDISPISPRHRWLRERLALLGLQSKLGHRYGHPLGMFRQVYGSNCVVGCLLELWADNVPDEATFLSASRVRRVAWDPMKKVGVLPRSQYERLDVLLILRPNCSCIDVASIRTRTWLMKQNGLAVAAAKARAVGPRLDSGLIEGSGPRSRILTQEIAARLEKEPGDFGGIRFRTRLGEGYVNWALFQRSPVGIEWRVPPRTTDPSVFEALDQLGLRLELNV